MYFADLGGGGWAEGVAHIAAGHPDSGIHKDVVDTTVAAVEIAHVVIGTVSLVYTLYAASSAIATVGIYSYTTTNFSLSPMIARQLSNKSNILQNFGGIGVVIFGSLINAHKIYKNISLPMKIDSLYDKYIDKNYYDNGIDIGRFSFFESKNSTSWEDNFSFHDEKLEFKFSDWNEDNASKDSYQNVDDFDTDAWIDDAFGDDDFDFDFDFDFDDSDNRDYDRA